MKDPNVENWCKRNSFWANFHLALAVCCEGHLEDRRSFSAAGEIIVAGPSEAVYKCQRCGCETISDVALCWTCVDEVLHKEEKNGQGV